MGDGCVGMPAEEEAGAHPSEGPWGRGRAGRRRLSPRQGCAHLEMGPRPREWGDETECL